jgi:hypothetical protein
MTNSCNLINLKARTRVSFLGFINEQTVEILPTDYLICKNINYYCISSAKGFAELLQNVKCIVSKTYDARILTHVSFFTMLRTISVSICQNQILAQRKIAMGLFVYLQLFLKEGVIIGTTPLILQ